MHTVGEQRQRMVDEQIAARGVTDPRVLNAMRVVPRHLFVPPHLQYDAYQDRPLPIGEGQTISQPYIVAIMTATLDVRQADRVLEIGTGSGYQAAVLAQLAASVVSIERRPTLAASAEQRLRAMGSHNVRVIVGDGTEGWLPDSPYDRILVTAGAPAIPQSLCSQLAEGGRLVIPVGPAGLQRLTVIDRRGAEYPQRETEACVFVPLIGRHGWAPEH